MNTKLIYEVTDLRRHVTPLLNEVATIAAAPGGLHVWGLHRHFPTFIPIDDEDPDSLVDKESEGRLEVATSDGRIIFQKFGMEQIDVIHAMFHAVPPLHSDEEVQQFFRQMMLEP